MLLVLFEKARNEALWLEFSSEEEARKFRFECYQLRRALRAQGNFVYDSLTFRLAGKILHIHSKGTTIIEMGIVR